MYDIDRGPPGPFVVPDLLSTVLYRFEQLPEYVLDELPYGISDLLKEPTAVLREETPGNEGFMKNITSFLYYIAVAVLPIYATRLSHRFMRTTKPVVDYQTLL